MMGMKPEWIGRDLLQLAFNCFGRLTGRKTSAICDPKDMRIDRDRLLTKGLVEHHVGGFPTNPGKLLQGFPISRHNSVEALEQLSCHQDHVLGLGIEQANGLDVLANTLLTQGKHLLGRVSQLEQLARGQVDADVRCLRREGNRNQQRVGINPLQLALRFGIDLRQPKVEFASLRLLQSDSTTSRME